MSAEEKKALQDRKRIGKWLKQRRTDLNRSLREAAKLGPCSDAWLSQLETANADVFGIRVDSLPKLGRAYSVPIATLVQLILGASALVDAVQ